MHDKEIKIGKLVRSRRKTIALVITNEAMLLVRAPLRTPLEEIQKVVSSKEVWIRKKILETSQRPKPVAKQFVNGEEFYFLGKMYKLRIVRNAKIDVELKDTLCIAEQILPRAHEILRQWYKAQASRVIGLRCSRYGQAMGCRPSAIKITEARKRWGSCNGRGMVNFSWRIIMAPLEIVDYLVVHELAHIGQLDHSHLFWNKVKSVLPDYRNHRKWLREHEGLLTI